MFQHFLIALHELIHLFKTTLVDRYYYNYPYYTDLKTQTYINLKSCQDHNVVNGQTSTQNWLCNSKIYTYIHIDLVSS